MKAAASLRVQLRKESQDLLIAWSASLAAIVLPALTGRWRGIELAAYLVGASGLGALSIGQEFSYRTLPVLLAQPIRRERLFAEKFGVLALMLAGLVVAFWLAARRVLLPFGLQPWETRAVVVVPVALGLFVAPYLTMICRSAVAGTIFSFSIPGVLMTAGALLHEFAGAPIAAGHFALVGSLTLGGCAAVASWRTFMSLEAMDGIPGTLRLPGWLLPGSAAREFTRQPPVWLLVKKELHLQQGTLIVAVCYVAAAIVTLIAGPRWKEIPEVFSVLSLFYAAWIAVMSGALASAEERLAGTLEWQLLMPTASRTQWAVKVAVSLGLTMVLGAALPTIFATLVPASSEPLLSARTFFAHWSGALTIALVTVASLYVSSVSSSGLRAMLVSMPALFVTAIALVSTFAWLSRYVSTSLVQKALWTAYFRADLRLAVAVVAAGGLVLLRYGLVNHRSADRSLARVLKQVAVVAVVLAAGLVAASIAAFFVV